MDVPVVEGNRHLMMLLLLAVSCTLLLGSRLQLIILVLFQKETAQSGFIMLILSMIFEFIFSALCTPMLLVFINISVFKIVILCKRSNWAAQDRDERMLEWWEVMDKLGVIAALAISL